MTLPIPPAQTPPKSRIEAELESMSRNPFRRLAAKHLQAALAVPEERLTEFAGKSPDRMAQSIAIYARGAGYTDKLELSASEGTLVALAELSDAAVALEYLRALREGRKREVLPASESVNGSLGTEGSKA